MVAVLPTLVIENARSYAQFYAQVHPLSFSEHRGEIELLNALFLTAMGSEQLVTNPHLRA